MMKKTSFLRKAQLVFQKLYRARVSNMQPKDHIRARFGGPQASLSISNFINWTIIPS